MKLEDKMRIVEGKIRQTESEKFNWELNLKLGIATNKPQTELDRCNATILECNVILEVLEKEKTELEEVQNGDN